MDSHTHSAQATADYTGSHLRCKLFLSPDVALFAVRGHPQYRLEPAPSPSGHIPLLQRFGHRSLFFLPPPVPARPAAIP